jgi:uncharacterized protein (TIGR02300 family)
VAKPELGSKRTCQNCGTKFFDLSKDPILCPKCGTVFQVVAAPSTRASRAAAARDDEEVETETGAEVVALEDADAVDDGKVAPAATDDDADADVEDDTTADDDDDTFLEDEEEDDADVSDLIDGDIEDDEER